MSKKKEIPKYLLLTLAWEKVLIHTCLNANLGNTPTCVGKYLGMNLLEDYALRFKIPEDTKLQLLHMIASHHGKQEYGAIVVPKTIEAEMLHFLDMIDSKMYAVEDALNNMGEDQNSTLVKSMNSTIYRF